MMPVPRLGEQIGCEALLAYTDPKSWFDERDTIKAQLAEHLRAETTARWLDILEPAGIWCADVLTWPRLMESEAFKSLEWTQRVTRPNGATLETTRCPIRIDGALLTSDKASPKAGEQSATIRAEFMLSQTGDRTE